MIEERTGSEDRAQLETNLFGALWITQAALPIMRKQGSGHIIQVSSIGGISAFPTVGVYHASKWALEGFSQSLSPEVAGFGINVTLVEPADPKATRGAILKIVDAEKLPVRIFFGKAPLDIATKYYESRLATWNEWQPVSIEAHGH